MAPFANLPIISWSTPTIGARLHFLWSGKGQERDPHQRAELTGLRGLAISLVYLFHLYPAQFPGGSLGVDLFFALSGFLITQSILKEYFATGRLHFGFFWLRRFLRLVPSLTLVTLFWCVVGLSQFGWQRMVIEALSVLTYVSNWTAGFLIIDYTYLPHTWSLSVEEQFYLLWPPALMLMLRLGRPAPLIFAFTIALAVTLWRVHLTLAGAGQWRLYMGLDTRLDAILVGCIGALTMRVTQIFAQKYPKLSQFIFLIAWLGLGTLVLNVSLFQRDFYLWALPIANVCCGIIVVGLECTPTRVVRRALAVKPLQILGRLSYVLYLWHFAFVLLNQRLMFVDPARIVLISASSLGLAVLTNLLVEQPAMNFGRRFRQSTPQAAAAP